MKKYIDLTLTSKSSTIGHYRFNDNLLDISGNENHLSGTGITNKNYVMGVTEEGNTAINLDVGEFTSIPAIDATDFDLGSSNVTIELILSLTSGVANIIGKGVWTDGWYIEVNASGNISLILDSQILTTINTFQNQTIYLVAVIDNVSGNAYLYIDGVLDNSRTIISFSNNTTKEFIVGNSNFIGSIDEVCISTEIMTALEIQQRALGQMLEKSFYQDGFIMNFLPSNSKGNADLKEFLIPVNAKYLELKSQADDLSNLLDYDKCPVKLLPLLANYIGFELIDSPYASESERRELLKWADWIYERKGTLIALQKIIEILGFSVTFNEIFNNEYPIVINKNNIWDRSLAVVSEFKDDFSNNLSKWNAALNQTSWWRIESNSLRGTGDGADSDTNGITFDDTKSSYYMEVTFVIATGHGINTEIGMYLNYENTNNWVRVELITDNNDQDFLVLRQKNGTESSTVLGEITNLVNYGFGTHKLWVFADHINEIFTVGIDAITVAYKTSFNIIDNQTTKKGLWVNRDLFVGFADVIVQTLDKTILGSLYDPNMLDRKLQITLTGTPANEQSKKDYLKQVLPEYVPAGVDIEYV